MRIRRRALQRREVAAIQIVSVALNSRESPIRFMNSTIGATPVRARPGAIRASAADQFSAQPFRRGRGDAGTGAAGLGPAPCAPI